MTDDATPNRLDLALQAAASDPASRPDFYRLLLQADVFIIGQTSRGGTGEVTLAADNELRIEKWQRQDGSPVIPFFTSQAALQRALDHEANYVALPARELFEMTRGATLVLNPKSPHGKEFYPNEIDALLTGAVTREGEERVLPKATNVLLGQPANVPRALLDALSAFFAKRPHVRAAYLALMHDAARDDRPHLVVGIQTDGGGDFVQLAREAGAVAGDTAPAGEAVDLCQVTPASAGLSAHFLESVEPFYVRRQVEAAGKPWWKRLFGGQRG